MLNVHRNHKADWERGEEGEGVWRWRKREIVYLSLHCHLQNDSCIKMGNDKGHFNFSLTVRDRVTGQCPQTTTFLKRKESRGGSNRGPSAYQSNALPLGQTGSPGSKTQGTGLRHHCFSNQCHNWLRQRSPTEACCEFTDGFFLGAEMAECLLQKLYKQITSDASFVTALVAYASTDEASLEMREGAGK